MHVNGRNSISFCSATIGLRELDKLNRQLCLEFKDIPSSTKFDLKFDTFYKNCNQSNFSPENYISKSKNLYKRIIKLREDFNNLYTLNEDKDYKILKQLIRKHKGANCRELVELMRYRLLEKGIDCHRVALSIKSKDYTKTRMASDHVFLVVNMKQGANFEKPATWGNKAIIVDPWTQSVYRASEGVERLKTTFKLDESYEYFKFFRVL